MSIPSITYGVALFTDDAGEIKAMFDALKAHGVTRLDTARIYDGSEELIGTHGVLDSHQFTVTTKAAVGLFPGSGGKENIFKCLKESFEALKVEKVHIYLLHGPDPSVPISVTMDAIQELYEQGRFEKFGLSNFSAKEVRECYDYAKSKKYVLPTVYQGSYSLLGRKSEKALFPTLRELGISIQAYSPIAGGFLAKSPEQFSSAGKIEGRWDIETKDEKLKNGAVLYNRIYNQPPLVRFLSQFTELAKKAGLGQVGLAYRWIVHHSALREEDTVIVGTKSLKQLEETLKEIEKGPLEAWVVEKLDEMWKEVEVNGPMDNVEAVREMIAEAQLVGNAARR